ncbi:MAG: VCBS repeat-containing protein [Myxococcales bacterium]|nr:VCBS repeat-containing protein [Myxococcales bacterium]
MACTSGHRADTSLDATVEAAVEAAVKAAVEVAAEEVDFVDNPSDVDYSAPPGAAFEFCSRGALFEVTAAAGHSSVVELGTGEPGFGYGPWRIGDRIWLAGADRLWTLEGREVVARAEVGPVRELAGADFDGDGGLELLATVGAERLLLVLDDWGLSPPPAPLAETMLSPGNPLLPSSYAFADLNDDGHLDLAWIEFGLPVILAGDGALGFSQLTPAAQLEWPFAYDFSVSCAAHDVDGDGRQEVLSLNMPSIGASDRLPNAYISIFRDPDGTGAFRQREILDLDVAGNAIPIPGAGAGFADMDGDTVADLIFAEGGVLWLFPGDPAAGFGSKREVGRLVKLDAGTLHVADFDGDGDRDVLMANGGLELFWGDGDGQFTPQRIADLPGVVAKAVARPAPAGGGASFIVRSTVDCD